MNNFFKAKDLLLGDIRYIILKKLRSEQRGTGEFIANDYLATVQANNGLTKDVGVIKRALQELILEGLIIEANKPNGNSRIDIIDSDNSSQGANAKDPLRFQLNPKIDLGCKQNIEKIRIYITLKGIQFLEEHEKFILDRSVNKIRKFTIIAAIVLSSLAVVIGGIKLFRDNRNTEQSTPIEIEQSIQLEVSSVKDTTFVIKDSFNISI